MTNKFEDVEAALQTLIANTAAEKEQVRVALGEQAVIIQELNVQVAALPVNGVMTQEQLDTLAGLLAAANAAVQDIYNPAAVEPPVTEAPVEPPVA